MTKFNVNSQYLLDTEINQMLKDIYSDAKDGFSTVTPLLTKKVQSIDWLKVKENTIKYSARTCGFVYTNAKKVDWLEVFEIIVAGILVACRGTYLAGLYTGKAMYWSSEKLAEAFKKFSVEEMKSKAYETWNDYKENVFKDPETLKAYLDLEPKFKKIKEEIEARLFTSPTPASDIPTASPATTPTPATETSGTPLLSLLLPLLHTSPDSTTTAQSQGVGDQNEGTQVSEQAVAIDNVEVEDLSVESLVEELDSQSMEQENAEAIGMMTYNQYQAMVESAEETEALCEDLENILDSVCYATEQETKNPYQSYSEMSVHELRKITGLRSKRHTKAQLIEAAIKSKMG